MVNGALLHLADCDTINSRVLDGSKIATRGVFGCINKVFKEQGPVKDDESQEETDKIRWLGLDESRILPADSLQAWVDGRPTLDPLHIPE